MAKTVKLLVTTIEGETCVFDAETLALSGMDEPAAREAFGANGYWLSLDLKDATFADQQRAQREADGDDTLLPQKRFAAGVTAWRKQVCNEDSTSVLEVAEGRYTDLPPVVANAINLAVLSYWYPVASKTADFMKAWSDKRELSEKESKSASSPSTPGS